MKKLVLIMMLILAVGCTESSGGGGTTGGGGVTGGHGCLESEGYMWHTEVGACAKEGEAEGANQVAAAKAAAQYLGNKDGLTLTRIDAGNCNACYTVHFSLEGELEEVKVSGAQVVQEFPTPVATPAATPLATPEPTPTVLSTYLNVVEKTCLPTSMDFEFWNTGCCNLGKPLARLYKVDGDGNVLKTCMEFTFPRDIKRNSRASFYLFNKDHGVEECDYSAGGTFRLEAIEADEGGVLFDPVTIKC